MSVQRQPPSSAPGPSQHCNPEGSVGIAALHFSAVLVLSLAPSDRRERQHFSQVVSGGEFAAELAGRMQLLLRITEVQNATGHPDLE